MAAWGEGWEVNTGLLLLASVLPSFLRIAGASKRPQRNIDRGESGGDGMAAEGAELGRSLGQYGGRGRGPPE
jgi:hypothetical protein